MSILQNIYILVSTEYVTAVGNNFIDTNLDLIQGILSLAILGLIFAVVVWIMVELVKFIGSLFRL